MIECKNGSCAMGKGNICCFGCPTLNCEHRCSAVPADCGESVVIEEVTDLAMFQNKAMAVMRKIAELDIQKKQLEAQDKAVRQELQEAMDKYGIKKFENDILKVTYVEPTTRTTIDSARLKKELPAIAEKYSKTAVVKGSVRIEVK